MHTYLQKHTRTSTQTSFIYLHIYLVSYTQTYKHTQTRSHIKSQIHVHTPMHTITHHYHHSHTSTSKCIKIYPMQITIIEFDFFFKEPVRPLTAWASPSQQSPSLLLSAHHNTPYFLPPIPHLPDHVTFIICNEHNYHRHEFALVIAL